MSLHTLLFRPDDILFCRDGRPMGGAGTGHGARLPDPHVLSGALHAACHRAFADRPDIGHRHAYRRRRDNKRAAEAAERFGALRSAGPFPVDETGAWFFPAPADIEDADTCPARLPVAAADLPGEGSLPAGLAPVANRLPPAKRVAPCWISADAYAAYLAGGTARDGLAGDDAFFAAEHTIGIGIDAATGATEHARFYSREQLRLREGCALGAYAAVDDKHRQAVDALAELFPETGRIALGGEGRTCAVDRAQARGPLALPRGTAPAGTRVKWILLSPALFPRLAPNARRDFEHPGGWLPSWIDPATFGVELLDGPGAAKARRLGVEPGRPVRARLVAACVPRAVVITGWTSGVSADRAAESGTGAKSTHLAVPAGAVYYFEADDAGEARKLADALNWHGDGDGTAILNRRSTLLGEKGFGLGVCGPWNPFGQ